MTDRTTVAVTGAGGFIGSHLAERLVEDGHRVRALVHYNALGRRGWLEDSPLAARMEIVAGDVIDGRMVESLVEGCDTVFHLAALIGIPYSYVAPDSYVYTNVHGTLNVLQAARRHGATVVHTSTSEVYGTAQTVPIDEGHPVVGQSPYSATKIGADKLAESFHLSFGLPMVTIRPFNTFGPRQSQRAVIPTIVTQALDGEDIRLGNLSPTRDLNFVGNTVDGFVMAADAPEAMGETINLATGREISIGDLARVIVEMVGSDAEVVTDEERIRPEGSEVERLVGDATKARRLIGWSPQVTLEEGLERTIDWIRRHRDAYRTGEYEV